ncbi:MAG: chemotaxis protein CheW [Nitrospiraceae bacterium]
MALRGYKAAATARDTQIRCLVMACGRCVLAVPADWVRSILTQEEAGYAETISSGGVAYTVTDLAGRLRLPSLTASSETRIILYGNENRVCAFAVDRVLELVEPERHELQPLPTQFRNAERHRLAGFFLYRETMALIVNPGWILEVGSQPDTCLSSGFEGHWPQAEERGLSINASPKAESHLSAVEPLK